MKILYTISQKPGFTGSGFYVQSMIKQALLKNHEPYLLSKIHKNDETQPIKSLLKDNCSFVEYETKELPFPVPGMSDVMPYKSTCFKNMDKKELSLYEKAAKKNIKKAVESFSPDVIHSNHLWLLSSYIKDIYPDIPLVITCHGTDLRQIQNCPHLKEKVIKGCKKADKIIALSNSQKNKISETYNISKSKIKVIGSGFDENLFSYQKKPQTPPVNILYAGKLSFSKGVLWLLHSIALLNKNKLPFNLNLAGTGFGKEYEEILNLGKKLCNVTFCGMLSHKELSEMMKKSNIFILPSFYEGLPLVILEALACGCRVITTDLPGTKELAGNIDSELIKFIRLPQLETIDKPFQKDMETLVIKLSKILNKEIEKSLLNPEIDPDKIASLIKNYTWKGIFSKIETIFTELIS
jgi:glycosyltransferase involved in cell wall biosynthesis